MSPMLFRVNPRSIVARMLKNSLLEAGGTVCLSDCKFPNLKPFCKERFHIFIKKSPKTEILSCNEPFSRENVALF